MYSAKLSSRSLFGFYTKSAFLSVPVSRRTDWKESGNFLIVRGHWFRKSGRSPTGRAACYKYAPPKRIRAFRSIPNATPAQFNALHFPSSQSFRLGTLRIQDRYRRIYNPPVLAESPPWDFEHILFMFIQVHILFPSKEYQAYSATALPNNNNHFRWNIAQLTSFTISSNLIYHSQSPEAETLRELIFYSC